MGEKLEHKTIREEVAIILRNKILREEIHQGDHIVELDLAEELGISRGPIREALRQLEQEGLVSYSSRKGCTVKIISSKDAEEIYTIRASLEAMSVEKCKCRFSDKTLDKMSTIIELMKVYDEKNDLIKIVECDQQFHECIIQESKMERLYDIWKGLNSSNAIIFYKLYHSKYSPNKMLASNHQIILDSIKSEEIEKACKDIRDNYMIVSENLYKEEN